MIQKCLYSFLIGSALFISDIKNSIKSFFSASHKGAFIYDEHQNFLWTETFGSKKNPSILLIHGAGSHRKFWPDSFCNNLAKHNFFVIRYDQRDSGYSARYKLEVEQISPYSFKDLMDDACKVLDYYQIKKAHIVGHSMGGCIVAGLLAYHADRLLTATIIGSGDIFTQEEQKTLNLSERSEELIKQLRKYKPTGWYQRDREYLLKKTRLIHGTYPINKVLFDEYAKEFYTLMQKKSTVKNHILMFKTIPKTLTYNLKASQFKIPTLIMHGTHDALVPYDWGKAVAQHITHAKFISLNGAGHMYFDQKLWTLFEKEILEIIIKDR